MNENIINLIPIMTSNTAPSGESFASEELIVGSYKGYAYKAFDRSIVDNGDWTIHNSEGYIGYKFKNKVNIIKYGIMPYVYNNILDRPLKNFRFEASNDNINYDILDVQSNITNWNINVEKLFNITNKKEYLYYRLYILNGGGNSSGYIGLGNLSMFGNNCRYLIKQQDNYYSIQSDYYSEETDSYSSPIINNQDLNIDKYESYSINDLSSIHINALNKLITDKYNIAMLK